MEEPTPKAGRKTPRTAVPKPPPATGKGQGKRAEPKPNQAKKTSAATATGRRTEAAHTVPERAPTGRAKPGGRDQAAGRAAKPTPPKDELVQMEIDLPDGSLRPPATPPATSPAARPKPAGPKPAGPKPTGSKPSEPSGGSEPDRRRRRARADKAATPATADPTPAEGTKTAEQPETTQQTDTTHTETAPQAEAASPSIDGAPQGGGEQHGIPLWAHLLADPGFAPEHAARAAVRALGPQAAAWVAAMRERYPSATPDGIARLAARELTRDARRLGAATPGGGPAVLATAGVVATAAVVGRTQARLVLTIAAAYGVDPTAEDRVRELLSLVRVPRLTEPTKAALTNLARVVAGVALCRVAARVMPFGSAIAGAVQHERTTAGVAQRAMARYGRLRTSAR